MLYWRAPNAKAGGKSAYNNVQVGGAPTQKLAESQLTIMCKLAGPQHREFRKEILQAMQVGGAPT
ncbi:nitrogen regulation protein NIFR3 [Staphylococcus aureus]|nr:nitrogen regulation protein NIFR3 [Staphylococcus aureus]CAC7659275.1 nitrogen regulation protein NIFR3 [Staphylococcus aureus]CAC7674063.1 nitrogen regulation protein NIFR3 [Staphylococcus aureus]CAC7726394.1 nitrogen regulation protein NIFR3 [Staphylococcus aureus]